MTIVRLFRQAALVAVISLVLTEAAHAQSVPRAINLSARLLLDDQPFEGSVSVTVELFRQATGGASVFQEDLDATAEAGVVALRLGTQTPLTEDVIDGSPLHLQLTVDGIVLSPRLAIGSVPYALRAERAASADKLGDLDEDDVQRRVAACAEGSSIRGVAADGSVTCEVDDTGATAVGSGLLLTSSGAIAPDFAVVQRRAGSCPANQSIRQINADGTVICEVDDSASNTAGTGILISGGAISPDFTVVQRRPAGCPANSSIRQINSDGTVVCDEDTNTTYAQECPAGSFVKKLDPNGVVTCAPLAPTEELSAQSTGAAVLDQSTAARSLCALTEVSPNIANPSVLGTDFAHTCRLTVSASQIWTLRADITSGDGTLTCKARCF